MNAAQLMHYKLRNGIRAYRRWVVPYLQSRLHGRELRPLLGYLYTEWGCNINCGYCFQNSDQREGMAPEMARRGADWLHGLGCRVLALMGGEPLIRQDFVVDLIGYAVGKGFFAYLPTNGYLLDESLIDRLGAAGVAAINLAVDCVHPHSGLPKALIPIEPQFRYLVRQQERYSYIVFFNMNITNRNLRDIKLLTEIAHDNGVATDYHINEPPLPSVEVPFYKGHGQQFCITPDLFQQVDELLDWVIEKNQRGYTMVNSVAHLQGMKAFMRGEKVAWECRAGHNGLLIRPDGSLTPCFGLMSHAHDWGRVGEPRFDPEELAAIKTTCHDHCFSTCYYTMQHYYRLGEALTWMFKHSRVGH